MTRRQIVKSASIAAAAMACAASGQDSARLAPAVKALVFDTFGTVVDWRGSIIEEGSAWQKTKGNHHRLGSLCRSMAVRIRAFHGQGAQRGDALDKSGPLASRVAGRSAPGVSY